MTATLTPLALDDPVARTRPHVTPADGLRQTAAMARRGLITMRRNLDQMFDVAVQPLLFTLLFAYVFGGAIAGGVTAYLPTLIPGILAQSTLTACMATGVQLREDMDRGVFDRFSSMPVARTATVAGPMVADLVRYAVAAVLTFATGVAMGYRPAGGVFGVGSSVLLVMAAGWSLAWVFAWVGTVARSARTVQGISMMIMFPLTFLSNAFVPVGTLPGWLQGFVRVNPVSHIVSAIRDLANTGQVTAQVGWALVGCTAIIAVFAPLAVHRYGRRS